MWTKITRRKYEREEQRYASTVGQRCNRLDAGQRTGRRRYSGLAVCLRPGKNRAKRDDRRERQAGHAR